MKIKDPNTSLPKCVLIAWCGGGVPERTKGYFTSHAAAVAKVLHGYHVQITARSDGDLEVDSIMKRVSDASGAKYSAASSTGAAPAGPPVKSKPVFTPTASSVSRSANPLVAARSRRDDNVDEDGWGADAPPVTRTEIQKVELAYRPTKVNMAEFTKQKPEVSRFDGGRPGNNESGDVVKGGYQPVGKVDIAAIRAAAKNQGDDRPTPVKGSYEPVGKVDIAAIRAKAQRLASDSTDSPKPVADTAAAFSHSSQSKRMSALPKPKVANKFGGTSPFMGTKAPAPGGAGLGIPGAPVPAPVGNTSRTFADEGGKTPAQICAEKKGRPRGSDVGGTSSAPLTSPVAAQKSGAGEWKSGYTGKSWAPVQTSGYSRGAPESVSQDNTGEADRSVEGGASSPSGGVSALRDRFKNVTPIGSGAPLAGSRSAHDEHEPSPAPPPVPNNSRPSGGFALPGLPSRPPPPIEDDAEESNGQQSPIRVAAPVPRSAVPELEQIGQPQSPSPMPPSQIHVPKEEQLPDDETAHGARGAVAAVAEETLAQGHEAAYQGQQGGKRAIIQYDYEKAEDNEIDLIEGEYVTNIDMVDDDWWMGTSSKGESGLFPSNYVELIEDDDPGSTAAAPAAPEAAQATEASPTATALYDYEAAEDNGESRRTLEIVGEDG